MSPHRQPANPLSPMPRRLQTTLLAGASLAASLAAPAADHRLNGHTFSLPDGFSIELAADNHLAPRPLAGSFDESGRLYVTDSSGSNKPPAEQLKDPQSRVLRLEDTDGDGRFDRSVVFADKVMFPQGCLWHNGSLYVAGPPSIWKFTDTNGDGVADQRTEWYQGQILTGCANDVHGPYLGPDGLLYWTKGAFGRLNLRDSRGRSIEDRCAHVFRAHPDGSGLESVMSGGMDNPVEVAFTAHGEPIVISTFIDLSQPGRRDGLAHAVYGGVFGKANDVLEEPVVRRTGGILPTMTHFGPAAACALMRYEGDAFGPAYRDNLFATLFNLRKVTRHTLQPHGASFTTQDSDFLVSDQADFHPTDVLQDIDGSLLVVDTGGWYKLCCPSSQLAKIDVLGGIYRVRRTGAPSAPTNPEARTRAYTRLAAPPALHDSEEATLKKAALTAQPAHAERFRTTLARHIPLAAQSPDSARLARLAAEGLGRLRDRAHIPALFQSLATATDSSPEPIDRFLEHSLIFALIETAQPDATRPFLRHAHPAIQAAALRVLEQASNPSTVQVADVIPFLATPAGPLRDAGLWVARRHPQWGDALASHFRSRLADPHTADAERTSWESMLDLLAHQPEGQTLLADITRNTAAFKTPTQTAALHAMAGSGLKSLPDTWRDCLLAQLNPGDASPAHLARLTAALRAVRSLPLPKNGDPRITERLRALAANTGLTPPTRIEAAGLLPTGSPTLPAEFTLLLDGLNPARPPGERLAAAAALQRLTLNPSQREALLPILPIASPIELPRLILAFSPGGDSNLGRRFIAALKQAKGLRSLRDEDLKPATARFPTEIQTAALEVLAAARTSTSEDSARLDALLIELSRLDGQIRRGQTIFNSTKAACSSCHRLGYLGGDIGPDLTSIGTSRTDRDLLEAVIHPSASFVRSYEPWIASTTDGEEHSGVLRRDTPDEIVLATGPGAEIRIPRSQLADLRLGSVSTMPAGLDEQLTRQELADLLAFLKNTRWGVN